MASSVLPGSRLTSHTGSLAAPLLFRRPNVHRLMSGERPRGERRDRLALLVANVRSSLKGAKSRCWRADRAASITVGLALRRAARSDHAFSPGSGLGASPSIFNSKLSL